MHSDIEILKHIINEMEFIISSSSPVFACYRYNSIHYNCFQTRSSIILIKEAFFSGYKFI